MWWIAIIVVLVFLTIVIVAAALSVHFHNITDQTKIAESDKSSGIRTCKDKELADRLIRNTYKTLMSRGQKGCFIYCEDEKLREHLKIIIKKHSN